MTDNTYIAQFANAPGRGRVRIHRQVYRPGGRGSSPFVVFRGKSAPLGGLQQAPLRLVDLRWL